MTPDTSRRWRLVLGAAFIATLMEYSIRGVHVLIAVPALAVLVFLNYFTFLVVMDHLIGKYRLKDYEVWLVAEFFAFLWQLVSVAGVYYPPFDIGSVHLGLNLPALLINNLVWWPTHQTVFALYLAHRVMRPVERSRELLSPVGAWGWAVAFVLISASFRIFVTPPETLRQFSVILGGTAIFGAVSCRLIVSAGRARRDAAPFEPRPFLDRLGVLTMLYLVFSFLFLTGGGGADGAPMRLLSPKAIAVSLVVSPLIALALLIERLVTRKAIPL